MDTIEINTVEEFHKQIITTHTFHAIFRGENSANYELRSKYGRAAVANTKNNRYREAALLEDFKRKAIPYLNRLADNDWDWLSIAQHHGLPTRLLDWTKNPLVAAYFAVLSPVRGVTDAVIYVCDEYSLGHVDYSVGPFDIKKDLIFRPKHTVERITTQKALFTVHHDTTEIFDNPTLQRWLLKKEMIINTMTMLRVYGIDETFMFPGLDSISKEIASYSVWDAE